MTDEEIKAEIDKLNSLAFEKSEPCTKMFGWVPESLNVVVILPLLIIGVLVAGIAAREFANAIFSVYRLNLFEHEILYTVLCSIVFFPVGWVLLEGIGNIDTKARNRVDDLHRNQIVGIKARIEFFENRLLE